MKIIRVICQAPVLPAVALLAFAVTMPKPAEAASFDIFLIAEQSTPSTILPTMAAPLSITTQTVYQLGLSGSNKASTITEVANFTYGANTPLSFSSLNDPSSGPSSADPTGPYLTDQGENGAGPTESGASTSHVNSEISSFSGSGAGADGALDFGRNSLVTFDSVVGGFTDLIFSDLGGIDPFGFDLCSDAGCAAVTQLFNGFKTSFTDAVLATGLFSLTDDDAFDPTTNTPSDQDQTWLFRFDAPVTDFVRIRESGDRTTFLGERLEGDFIGAQSSGSLTPVPGPAGLPLLASGIILLGWRQFSKKH